MSNPSSKGLQIPDGHEVVTQSQDLQRPAVVHRQGEDWYVTYKENNDVAKTESFTNEGEARDRFSRVQSTR